MRRRGEFQAFSAPGRVLALHASAYGAMLPTWADAPELFESLGPVAVVDIGNGGPLVQHKGSRWDSYDAIAERVRAAAASNAKGIILRIDSPGGDALGMIECAHELRATCKSAGKYLLAFVDGMACSAAYALASAASVIVVPPAGLVGSVGVYKAIVDATAADRAMGLQFQFYSSGERKLDGNPHIPITDAAGAETQRHVDELAGLFFGLVGDMRPRVTADSVRALQGGSFLGQGAKDQGLADEVGTWADALAMVASSEATAAAAARTEAMADEKKEDKASAKKAAFAAITKAAADLAGALAAFGDDSDDKKEEPAKDEPAKEPKKEEKAAAEEPKKEDEKKDEGAAAKALSLSFETAKEMAMLKAKIAASEDAGARAKLLAKRPDFDEKILAVLAGLPLSKVQEAVDTFPRIGPARLKAVASPVGTRGETQTSAQEGGEPEEDPDAADHIRRKMTGRGAAGPVAKYAGGVQSLEFADHEQARARLAEIKKGGVL